MEAVECWIYLQDNTTKLVHWFTGPGTIGEIVNRVGIAFPHPNQKQRKFHVFLESDFQEQQYNSLKLYESCRIPWSQTLRIIEVL